MRPRQLLPILFVYAFLASPTGSAIQDQDAGHVSGGRCGVVPIDRQERGAGGGDQRGQWDGGGVRAGQEDVALRARRRREWAAQPVPAGGGSRVSRAGEILPRRAREGRL